MSLSGSFYLKPIDWELVLIVFGIFVGVVVLSCFALLIEKMLNKKKVQEGETTSVVKLYIKNHLTELVYAFSLVVIIVLIFVGQYYILWYTSDWENTLLNGVLMYKLIFGGEATLLDKTYTFTMNPVLLTSFALVLFSALLTLIFLFVPHKNKLLIRICNVFSLLATSIAIIMIVFNFTNFKNIYDFSSINTEGMIPSLDAGSYETFFVLLLLILLALCNVRRTFSSVKYTTQDICEEGILIALAVVFDTFIKIKVVDGAGSIGIAAIPLFIIAIRHGPYKGFIASAIMFGLITCMIDGYGFQTYPFDYFIGFGGYAAVGLFYWLFSFCYKNKTENYKLYQIVYSAIGISVGCLVAMVIRYVGSCSSSMILYDYTLVDAIIYNSSYIPLTMLIDWAILLVLLKPILLINERFKYNQIG